MPPIFPTHPDINTPEFPYQWNIRKAPRFLQVFVSIISGILRVKLFGTTLSPDETEVYCGVCSGVSDVSSDDLHVVYS